MSAETGQMSSLETGQISSLETGQMSFDVAGNMSADSTGKHVSAFCSETKMFYEPENVYKSKIGSYI